MNTPINYTKNATSWAHCYNQLVRTIAIEQLHKDAHPDRCKDLTPHYNRKSLVWGALIDEIRHANSADGRGPPWIRHGEISASYYDWLSAAAHDLCVEVAS